MLPPELEGYDLCSKSQNQGIKRKGERKMNLPNKKYKIIYADPPWEYEDKAKAGNRGACCKYSVMSINDLENIPVKDIADNDCILFMWITFPMIKESLKLIESWGFEYKTVAFIWIKKTEKGTWFMGMGNWTRANAEICLLATKGKPRRINAGIVQVVDSVVKEHSKKPDEVRKRIVQLCGDLPRIELFARTRVHGWDVWGNDEKLELQPLEVFQS